MTIANKLALLEQTKEAQRVKLGLPKNLPFNQYIKFIRDPFSISELYKKGEKGIWLDPRDLTTMFQNASGATPVAKDGQPVGLILDKSQGLKTVAVEMPEEYRNMQFPFYVGYGTEEDNIEVLDNGIKIKYTKDRRAYLGLWRFGSKITLNKGSLYKISVYISEMHGTLFESVWGFGYWHSSGDHTRTSSLSVRGFKLGWNSFTVRIPENADWNAGIRFPINSTDEGSYVIYSKFKIEEILGNHATQETAASRPIYRTDDNLHWSEFDGVDDALNAQLPSGIYTEIKASRDGVTHKYPVNINSSYTLGDLTQTKQSVSGLVLVNRQLTQAEIENVTNLMKVKAGLPL